MAESEQSGHTIDEAGNTGRKPALGRRVVRVLVLLGVVYGAGISVACSLQSRLLFPGQFFEYQGGPAPSNAEVWTFAVNEAGDEGRAVFIPTDVPGKRPAVIFAHGNGEAVIENYDLARFYGTLGVHVLMPEYRGYDGVVGTPSEQVIVGDFVLCYDQLVQHEGVDTQAIVFHGRSIGGGVVGSLASEREPAALIIESSFTSVANMAWRFGVPGFLVRSPFSTIRTLERYKGPVLFVHGEEDQLIPISQMESNIRAAVSDDVTEVRIPRRGHNDVLDDPAYWGAIHSFIGRLYPIDQPEDD
ncbi:MAG: alpha/beta hydrolase [Planctomycetota bacterium]